MLCACILDVHNSKRKFKIISEEFPKTLDTRGGGYNTVSLSFFDIFYV